MEKGQSRKGIIKTLVFIIIISMLASCAPAPAATSQAPANLKVVILPYTSFGPFFIAQEEGFFTEQNLTVEFVPFDSGTSPLPLLEEGQIDVLGSGPSVGLFNAVANGGTMKMVADKGYLAADGCTYMALLAPTAWVDANQTPTADALKGLKVSIDPTNFEAFMIEKLLGDVGLSLDDVVPQDIAPPALADAVTNKAVDLISIGDPWITRLLDTGLVSIWKPYQDIVPNMQFGVVLFGKNLLNGNPDLGNRFMTAYLKGIRQYNLGKTDRNLEIMSKYTKLDTELLKRACWPPMNETGTISLDTVEQFQTWAVGKGLLDKAIDVNTLWDPQFIEQAAKNLK